jgi:predicted O-methyltransferase YrrM
MNEILQEIYRTGAVQDETGHSHKLHSGLSPRHAETLYRLVREHKPTLVVEVGMAYGLSTLAILQALHDNRHGRLISLDPYQRTDWHGVGLHNVRRAGLIEYHELIEEPSYLALPALLRNKKVVDFAYVDGWHTFDYVLVDFFYLDKLLRPDGVIGFNDCGLAAVDRVLAFIRTHRRYEEIRKGVPRDYRGRHPLITFIRWVFNKPRSDRYFVKKETWEPPWNFYARF